jgi:hypothetical protein
MRWEYLLLRVKGATDIADLTRAGDEGWEAFAAVPTGSEGAVVFLKRERLL